MTKSSSISCYKSFYRYQSYMFVLPDNAVVTPGRRQLKKLLTINEGGSKIARNSVFDCHLLPVWQQMAIENSVSNNF